MGYEWYRGIENLVLAIGIILSIFLGVLFFYSIGYMEKLKKQLKEYLKGNNDQEAKELLCREGFTNGVISVTIIIFITFILTESLRIFFTVN